MKSYIYSRHCFVKRLLNNSSSATSWTPNMPRKGTHTDNAIIESFYAILKVNVSIVMYFHKNQTVVTFDTYINCYRIQLNTKLTPIETKQVYITLLYYLNPFKGAPF